MKQVKFLSLAIFALTMTFGLNAQTVTDAIEQFNKGHEAYNAGNYEQAIADFEVAYTTATAVTDEDAAEAIEGIKTNCKNLIPHSYTNIANSLASEKKFDEAIEYFNKSLTAAEKYGNTDITKESVTEKTNSILLAKHIADGDLEKAFALATETNDSRAEQIGKAISNTYLKDAQEALKTKSYATVIEKSKQALEYNSENINAYNMIGTSALQLKQYKNAIDAFEKSIEIKESAQIYYNLGVAYQQSGNNPKACQNYKKVNDPKFNANAQAQIKAICK
jgi:Predicted N-acetylglucosaminyl transferase